MSQEIDANKIIEALRRRIGQLVADYETEIAVRDAIIEQHNEEHADIPVAGADAPTSGERPES